MVAIRRKDNFHDEYRLETLIPRLPPAFTGIVWKSVPSAEKIEVSLCCPIMIDLVASEGSSHKIFISDPGSVV